MISRLYLINGHYAVFAPSLRAALSRFVVRHPGIRPRIVTRRPIRGLPGDRSPD